MDFRCASADDLSVLARDANTSGLLRERLQRQADNRGELWVALQHSHPVGYVFLWLDDADEDIVRDRLPGVPLIMNLWVYDDRRKSGFGRALMQTAEDRLRTLGHKRVALGVAPDDTHAIEFYEQLMYVRWEYGSNVETVRLEFSQDGDVTALPDTCTIFVKDLCPAGEPVAGCRF